MVPLHRIINGPFLTSLLGNAVPLNWVKAILLEVKDLPVNTLAISWPPRVDAKDHHSVNPRSLDFRKAVESEISFNHGGLLTNLNNLYKSPGKSSHGRQEDYSPNYKKCIKKKRKKEIAYSLFSHAYVIGVQELVVIG